jgi:GNAT superfamily N-acetyltransferase
MTTTIRPSGPETVTPEGGRRRTYSVCVNGRVVGGLTAHADGGAGGTRGGRVSELVIDRRDRGRGRGIIAVLAAEEVLRAWGCTRAEARVPAGQGEEAGLGLARTLGYVLASATLRKALTGPPPPLPPGRAGHPMGEDEYGFWLAAGARRHVGKLVAAGLTPEQAAARFDAAHAAALPQGPDSPDTVLRVLEADGVQVGTLWVHTRHGSLPDGSPLAWVFDIVVDEARRGRGHGRALMLLAERECLAHGVTQLGLNVFAHNGPARRLYASLGYTPVEHVLRKRL